MVLSTLKQVDDAFPRRSSAGSITLILFGSRRSGPWTTAECTCQIKRFLSAPYHRRTQGRLHKEVSFVELLTAEK